MMFGSLTADGSIDERSHEAYMAHLESIRGHLDPALYEMLRFPEAAYRSGRTIYDSILVEWRGVLDRESWKSGLNLRIDSSAFTFEEFAAPEPGHLQ